LNFLWLPVCLIAYHPSSLSRLMTSSAVTLSLASPCRRKQGHRPDPRLPGDVHFSGIVLARGGLRCAVVIVELSPCDHSTGESVPRQRMRRRGGSHPLAE
jgi:hypothetical protein